MRSLRELVAGAAAGLVLAVLLAYCLWVGVHASDWTKVAAGVAVLAVFLPLMAWVAGESDGG